MKLSKKLTAMAMVAVMALGVTACGGSEPAAEDDTKTYIIATDTTFAPFEFQNEAGEYVGIDIELLAAIAEDQGIFRHRRRRRTSAPTYRTLRIS